MHRKFILLSASLLLAIPASASLIAFTVDNSPIQTVPGGYYDPVDCQDTATLSCVIFDGTITFTPDQDYYALDIAIVLNPSNPDGGADVVGNDNYFFSAEGPPGIYGPDGVNGSSTYTGGLFEVDVASNTPLGIYTGTAQLEATDNGGDTIASTPQNFQINVVASPEPGMGALMLVGFASLAAMGRRFRRNVR
jgi:hypothetical protein